MKKILFLILTIICSTNIVKAELNEYYMQSQENSEVTDPYGQFTVYQLKDKYFIESYEGYAIMGYNGKMIRKQIPRSSREGMHVIDKDREYMYMTRNHYYTGLVEIVKINIENGEEEIIYSNTFECNDVCGSGRLFMNEHGYSFSYSIDVYNKKNYLIDYDLETLTEVDETYLYNDPISIETTKLNNETYNKIKAYLLETEMISGEDELYIDYAIEHNNQYFTIIRHSGKFFLVNINKEFNDSNFVRIDETLGANYFAGAELFHQDDAVVVFFGAQEDACGLSTIKYKCDVNFIMQKYVPYYKIFTKTDSNGTIETINKSLSGKKINFIVTPKKGYELDYVKVTDEDGNTITIKEYSSSMPNSNVTIEAVFKIKNPLTKDSYILPILFLSSISVVAFINFVKKIKQLN